MVVTRYLAALVVISAVFACGDNASSVDGGPEGGVDAASDAATDGGFVYRGPAIGTNLSGMEWAAPGLRYGTSTLPNLNFTVPRKETVAYLAADGFTKTRLPVQWELLQPMLYDTVASAQVTSAVGQAGAFDATYAAYITDVLDAHAAAGIKAIIDLHNYCRYQDFVYQPDGSVKGFVVPSDPLLRPYTSDSSQVQVRLCALAPGATLTPAELADFWTRAAKKWKDHPGFGGYGLMNEPHDLPAPGAIVSGGTEDLTIWPTFAQAAIDAIRAVDPVNPIYVGGNDWSAATAIATQDPGFPLKGNNLVYEVHMYLDASSSGYAFDYDTEVAKGYSAGLGNVPIDQDTGVNRLKIATDWATANGAELALTEVGMPIDDVRWQTMFERAVGFALQQGVEVYTWMGGDHWTIHNYALNQTAGFDEDQTLEPSVSGALKAAAGVPGATLYDDGPGWAPSGTPVTINVYARGNLTSPLTLTVASDKGGTFSKTTLTIPAGANGEDSFTYTPGAGDAVATLTYASAPSRQLPPPREVYSIADPVAYAATSPTDAARAILAKYGAAEWMMADAYTDCMQGAPAADGQTLRAISDSGFGSSEGNALEMLNWTNKDDAASGTMALPILRTSAAGKKYADMRAANTWGFWCKKSVPIPGVQANPRNRVPYGVDDAHFAIAAVAVPTATNDGVVFQATKSDDDRISELALAGGHPQARWIDANGQTVQLTAPSALAPDAPAVLALTSTAGAQSLRVNGQSVATAAATFAPSVLDSLLVGWGFVSYYPRAGFGGDLYAVIAGKGAPTEAELQILERYLAAAAGTTL